MSVFTEYRDSAFHPELQDGKTYCVKTHDDFEVYAKFKVCEGGEEVAFLQLQNGKEVSPFSFRCLDEKELNVIN